MSRLLTVPSRLVSKLEGCIATISSQPDDETATAELMRSCQEFHLEVMYARAILGTQVSMYDGASPLR